MPIACWFRLAARFYEQDRWAHGIEAYELVLGRMSGDERAPRWQLAVARGRASLGESNEATEALAVLADRYLDGSEWASQQSDPALVAETEEMIERAIRVRAMRWHDLAQRGDQQPLFERAARLYEIYLDYFDDSEQAYNLRFYRAEILFHRLERYGEAGENYLAAARANRQGEYTRDALYNAIGSFEHVREVAARPMLPSNAARARPDPNQSRPTRKAQPKRGQTTRPRKTRSRPPTIRAARATTTGSSPKRSSSTSSCSPTTQTFPRSCFVKGQLYYDRQIYDPAVRLFGQLLERFPNSPYAITAGERILESFNRARDYQNIETWARRLKSSPAFQTEESQRRLDALILFAVFATGEQLANRGQHSEAAEAYLRAAREFPRDERAPQAYYNAGLEYQEAGSVASAATAYDQLIANHPRTEIGARGAWRGAQMYESIAQFRDAARFYEQYFESFGGQSQAEDALYNATLLRVTAGDHDRAVQNGQRFIERFRGSAQATEVTFLMGRANASAQRWQRAAEVYRRFIRSTRDVNRQIEANTRLAQVLAEANDTRGSNNALAAAVRLARRGRARLNETGLYYAAQARFLQAEAVLAEYEAIQIAGPMEGLRQRLEQKSDLLRRAAEAFAEVVQFNVAAWVTAALFQIGRSYELYAEGLRNAPTPEGLSEEEEQAYFDQLSSFVIPIEERALEAFEGGYRSAIELRIFNRWTAQLREGLTRLNDVQYPPLREMGGDITDGAAIPMPEPLSGLRRGEVDDDEEEEGEDEDDEEIAPNEAPSTSMTEPAEGASESEPEEDAESEEEARARRRRARRRRARRRRARRRRNR